MKIQAHRGASKERPENTMSAFIRARELQADGIELDVHLLPDGTLAVHHDAMLGRCEQPQRSIYEYDAASIKTFSVGDKFSPRYAEEKVPLFREVLEFLKDNALFLNVEIKADSGFLTDIAAKTAELLEEYHMAERCIISSFQHEILKEITKRFPNYKTGALYVRPYRTNIAEYCKYHGFAAAHPYYRYIDQELVRACHKYGIQVNAWTVDQDFEKMDALGVDTVITNDVASAKRCLERESI